MMIEIAEFTDPSPSPLWRLWRRRYVVGGLPTEADARPGERPWDLGPPLARMKQRYEEGGFRVAVIEARLL
jgi:hypothetical protein